MCDDSNTQYLHPSIGEEELDADNYIAPPKMSDYLKDMLVKAKLQFEGFDNATQPQKPHWESVRPVFAFFPKLLVVVCGPNLETCTQVQTKLFVVPYSISDLSQKSIAHFRPLELVHGFKMWLHLTRIGAHLRKHMWTGEN